jgi:hypothetical protein
MVPSACLCQPQRPDCRHSCHLLGNLENAQQSLLRREAYQIPYVFMNYWAGLNNDADQVALRAGAESLVALAMAMREANPPPGERARLGPGVSSSSHDTSMDRYTRDN